MSFILMFILNIFGIFFMQKMQKVAVLKKHFEKFKKPPHAIQIFNDSADFIDFILLSLNAGKNIQHSFMQAAQNTRNAQLKAMTDKVRSSHMVGLSFSEALKNALKDAEDVTMKAILENLWLGIRMGGTLVMTLENMSFTLRSKARTELESYAAQAPVKMIFPLVFFIFPVIFILLGAGILQNAFQFLD